jgi:hypothetical protein
MVRSRSWLCTWNNFPDDWKDKILLSGAIDYAGQKEKGENAEKEHIQFAVRFENQIAFVSMQAMFEGAHIEPAKNWCRAKQYCQKKETQVEAGIVSVEPPICKDPLAGKAYRPLQQEIMDIIKEQPDDRSIHWFYDPEGNAGKTTIAKHICLKNKDAIYVNGKAGDMKYACMLQLKSNDLKTVIIDLTRQIESFVSYQGMEEIKNGIFFSTKYECGMCLFDNPHVIILANFYPDTRMLSADRWRIHEMEEGQPIANPPRAIGYDDLANA